METAARQALPAPGAGEREFRELADNAPVMIWRARPDGSCDWFNRPWLEFVGGSLEQQVGRGWAAGIHPDDRARRLQAGDTAFDIRRPFVLPYRMRRHDGEYRWLLDHGAPFDRDGLFAGYFGSCVDITEVRDAESRQAVLLAELNHRVKNNLQLIIAFLSLSAAQARTDEARDLLRAAITRVRGVGTVQEQLHQEVSDLVDLGQYLPRLAAATLRAEAGEAGRLVVEAAPASAPLAQASALGLIVNELITHAVRGGARGEIVISIGPLGDGEAQLSVTGRSGAGLGAAEPPPPSQALIDALAQRAHARVVHGAEGAVRVIFPLAGKAGPAAGT